MDFRSILSSSHITLKRLNIIRDEILQNSANFEEVYSLIFDKSFKQAWRAAWVLEKVCEKNSSFFTESHTLQLMAFSVKISNSKTTSGTANNSLKRTLLAILKNLPIPENISVEFINICFERMASMKEPIAVQVLSMKMLVRISGKKSDFIPEIIATLDNIDLTSVSAGFIAARKQTMKALSQNLKS